MTKTPDKSLLIGHSPDPDDAFMWWPLGTRDIQGAPASAPGLAPSIETKNLRFTPVAQDIQSLNQRAMTLRDLHVTALSVFALGHVLDTYALTTCGGSFGLNYGPKVLVTSDYARQHGLKNADPDQRLKHLHKLVKSGGRVAVPGTETSAYLVLRLILESTLPPAKTDKAGARFPAMRFDTVIPALIEKRVDAALVIHEAQVTYEEQDLHLLVDLGEWWSEHTGGLPLPMGANAVRRDAGDLPAITGVLDRSIRYALEHREQSLDYAMHFAAANAASSPPSREQVDHFVKLYVNDLTLDLGEEGAAAVAALLYHGRRLKLLPDHADLALASPEPVETVPIALPQNA